MTDLKKKYDSSSIANAVVKNKGNPFNLRINECVIQNVSWGLFSWGEADLIALTKSGYLIEGEIKISKQDFLKDKDKWKWDINSSWSKDIKRFFYIVPIHLKDFAMENTDRGVISVSHTETGIYKIKIERDDKCNVGRKLFIEEKMQLLRLGSMRAWRS
jgi:hypothetical protein